MSTPHNESRVRVRLVGFFILLIWGVLIARLLHIQWWRQEDFTSIATRQQVSSETILARPGDILDRRGRLLATTITVPSFYVDPAALDNPHDFAAQVAPVLGLSAEKLSWQIQEASSRRFLWVKRRLTEEEQQAIEALQLPAHVCGMKVEYRRHYPQGSLAAHVIGLRDIDGQGRGGIEQTFNEQLQGHDGKRRFVRDARGHVLDVLEEVTQPPVDGAEITLTLDAVIQLRLEQQLDELVKQYSPCGVCGIVLDPQRGEILAMGSRPTLDPNRPQDASELAWKNLCISAVYEPGSTFKPLVVARALDLKTIQPYDNLDCEHGAYRMGPRVLHDHHPYGFLSVSDVLVKSSNIGMAKIGESLGNEELYRLALDYGFGQPTGVELPGELTGLLRPYASWNQYSTGSIPMGQELAATPLQMITAHAVLANGGRRITPHLLKSAGTPQPQHVVVSQVVSPQNARWIVQGPLHDVVARGTGTKAKIEGIEVFGKTGTAQKYDAAAREYSHSKHVCSFICGAPANDPQVLVLITVDEPQGGNAGGTVAAPIAANVLKESLQYLRPHQVVERPLEGSAQ